MSAMTMMQTVPAATRRATTTSGKQTQAVFLVGLKMTPLDPVDAETRNRLALQTPHEVMQTFVEGDHDIKPGDVLVVDDKDYPVRAVGEWTWRKTMYRHLIVEDLRR